MQRERQKTDMFRSILSSWDSREGGFQSDSAWECWDPGKEEMGYLHGQQGFQQEVHHQVKTQLSPTPHLPLSLQLPHSEGRGNVFLIRILGKEAISNLCEFETKQKNYMKQIFSRMFSHTAQFCGSLRVLPEQREKRKEEEQGDGLSPSVADFFFHWGGPPEVRSAWPVTWEGAHSVPRVRPCRSSLSCQAAQSSSVSSWQNSG